MESVLCFIARSLLSLLCQKRDAHLRLGLLLTDCRAVSLPFTTMIHFCFDCRLHEDCILAPQQALLSSSCLRALCARRLWPEQNAFVIGDTSKVIGLPWKKCNAKQLRQEKKGWQSAPGKLWGAFVNLQVSAELEAEPAGIRWVQGRVRAPGAAAPAAGAPSHRAAPGPAGGGQELRGGGVDPRSALKISP